LMNMHIGEHPSALIYYRFYLYLYDLFEQTMLSIDNHHSQSSPALVAITTHIHILTLNLGNPVRFKQKGQKQASLLAVHECCQGCLLRGPLYIATEYQESLFVG
jgi:hypothetical protein